MKRVSARIQAKKQALFPAEGDTGLTAMDSDVQSSASGHNLKRAYEESSEDDFYEEKSGHKRRTQKKAKKSTDVKTDEAGGTPAQSMKRTRKRRADDNFKKIRGKLGILDRLVTDVPIEVIFEVFSYLHPLDILHLARVSKDLRGILMNKSAESVWRAARLNVPDLPPLPRDLNEPQYVNLMFDWHCQVCLGKSRCENVSWEYRLRCCKKCEANTFTTTRDFSFHGISWSGFDKIRRYLPTHLVTPSYRRQWNQLEAYVPAVVLQYVAEYEAVEGDPDMRTRWCLEHERQHEDLVAHAKLCQEWHSTQLSDRVAALNAVRASRLQDILSKLQGIGWDDEAQLMMKNDSWELTSHKLVSQPTKLTERGWANIQQPLVQFLEEHKTHRLEVQRREALYRRYNLLKSKYGRFQEEGGYLETGLVPGLGDIITSGIFDFIIWKTPFDQAMPEKDFSGIFDERLPTLIAEWRAATEDKLLDILRKSVPTSSKSDLHLATSVFECRNNSCLEPLWYSRVSFHQISHSSYGVPTTVYGSDHVDTKIFDPCARYAAYPWNSELVKYSPQFSQAVRKIVEACGLDPSSTTTDDLFASNPLIDCKSCSSGRGRYFYWWWYATQRHADHILSINEFGEFTDEILAASKEASERMTIRCRFCHSCQWLPMFNVHLASEHDIQDAPTEEHWYRNPTTPFLISAGNYGFSFEEPRPTPQNSEFST